MIRIFVKKGDSSCVGILDVDNKTWETLVCGICNLQTNETMLVNSSMENWKTQIYNMLCALDVGKSCPELTDWEYINPEVNPVFYKYLVEKLISNIHENFNIKIEP